MDPEQQAVKFLHWMLTHYPRQSGRCLAELEKERIKARTRPPDGISPGQEDRSSFIDISHPKVLAQVQEKAQQEMDAYLKRRPIPAQNAPSTGKMQ